MTDRRSHWDDSLVESVIHAISDNYDYEYRAYAVIAAVEDWQKERFKWSDIIQSPFEVAVRHNAAEERAEKAEAAITRVRDVVENTIILANDAGISYPNVSAEAVLRALDGGAE